MTCTNCPAFTKHNGRPSCLLHHPVERKRENGYQVYITTSECEQPKSEKELRLAQLRNRTGEFA